jgi:hypothetical protein
MKIHEFGMAEGAPVIFFFGTPQRGDAGAEIDSLASSHGIRLICPTRPWYDEEHATPSFDAVTIPVLQYMSAAGITSAYAMGGSGGGPFALHLAIQGVSEIRDCTLLCSMGLPESFARDVTSPPTLEVLKALEGRDRERWNAACARWGLPPDLAQGAWGDFTTFFDCLPHMDRRISKPVYVYHGEADPNAPLGSIRELLADATDVRWNINESASHVAMAQDKSGNVIGQIFEAISTRSRTDYPSV